jgi:cob(I)alamin adenosyltransferase
MVHSVASALHDVARRFTTVHGPDPPFPLPPGPRKAKRPSQPLYFLPWKRGQIDLFQRDIAAARAAWEQAKQLINDSEHKLVLLDELNIVLRYDYLPLDEVLAVLRAKPADKHVIITGRNAREELIDMADLVTEMTMVKHPFRDGVKPQAGIEF